MEDQRPKLSFLKRGGRFGVFLGFAWIALNIVVPLVILRIPLVQDWLVEVENYLPFDIPGVG